MEDRTDKKPKILIVDDEQACRQEVANILKGGGYDTVEAASGADVPTLLGREEIGLVLADLEMPDISGPEILRKVKSLRPEVPVIVTSKNQDFYAVRGVLSSGALYYLLKPIDEEELLAVVERGVDTYNDSLEAMQSNEEAQRLLADLVLLREVGETANREADLDVLVDKIIEKVVAAVAVKTASIMLPAKDGNLRIRASRGLPKGVSDKAVIKPGEGVSGHVFESGEPVLLTDIVEDGRFAPAGDEGQYTTASALSLPLKGRDKIIGVLNVNNKLNGETFSVSDQTILASISHQASLAIENYELVRRLRKNARELEALSSARSRLVCNLSHELNTPLTLIMGFTDLLREHRDQIVEAELNDYLQKINTASQQMEKIVSGMLLLFSIDTGSANWFPEPISVADICASVTGLYAEAIEKNGLKVQLEFEENLPPIHADIEKFRLLIDALVDNAVKFNTPGGQLLIQGQSQADESVSLRIYNDGTHVPVESAEEVFAQYSQLGEINTAKPEGVGIGLALCRIIVKKIGGSIFLEETSGRGTAFGLVLPANKLPKDHDDED